MCVQVPVQAKGAESPGAGVTGVSEPALRNWTLVFWKNSHAPYYQAPTIFFKGQQGGSVGKEACHASLAILGQKERTAPEKGSPDFHMHNMTHTPFMAHISHTPLKIK